MSVEQLLVAGGLLILSTLPIDRMLLWIFSRAKYIDDQLEKPHLRVYTSKRWLGFGFAQLLHFGLGYAVFYCMDFYIGNLLVSIVLTPLLLLVHRFSVFSGFKSSQDIILMVWGIYAYIYWPMAIIFPIVFVLFSLLLNTISLGFVLAIFSAFFVFWLNLIDPYALLYNFMIFAVALYAERDHVTGYIEGNKRTIMQSFMSR
ncbi:MAG: hypothetical protein O3A01_01700 [bacterium]|nr:hypothetical protein [bacterium]